MLGLGDTSLKTLRLRSQARPLRIKNTPTMTLCGSGASQFLLLLLLPLPLLLIGRGLWRCRWLRAPVRIPDFFIKWVKI